MFEAPGKIAEVPSTKDTVEVAIMPQKRAREEDELVQNDEKRIRMQ